MMQNPELGDDPVLVAIGRLDSDLIVDIQEACVKAHARFIPWNGELGLPGLQRRPSVLVSGLRVGERRISEDLIELATKTFPGMSLLVLSREPLVRPTMTLQNGRVTLVSPPLSTSHIASALRSILGDRRLGYTSTDTAPGLLGGSSVVVKRLRRAKYWLGTFAADPDTEVRERPTPYALPSTMEGLTVLLPSTKSESGMGTDFGDWPRIHRSDEELSALFDKQLGVGTSLVHLNASGDEWTFYWPNHENPLVLCSPLRLPPAFDLATAMKRANRVVHRMPAANCDTLAAFARGDDALDLSLKGVATLLGEGGAPAADMIEQQLVEHSARVSGAFIEVF